MFVELSTISVNLSSIDCVLFDSTQEITLKSLKSLSKEGAVQVSRETLIFIVNRDRPLVIPESNPKYEDDKLKLKNALHPGIPL